MAKYGFKLSGEVELVVEADSAAEAHDALEHGRPVVAEVIAAGAQAMRDPLHDDAPAESEPEPAEDLADAIEPEEGTEPESDDESDDEGTEAP